MQAAAVFEQAHASVNPKLGCPVRAPKPLDDLVAGAAEKIRFGPSGTASRPCTQECHQSQLQDGAAAVGARIDQEAHATAQLSEVSAPSRAAISGGRSTATICQSCSRSTSK